MATSQMNRRAEERPVGKKADSQHGSRATTVSLYHVCYTLRTR